MVSWQYDTATVKSCFRVAVCRQKLSIMQSINRLCRCVYQQRQPRTIAVSRKMCRVGLELTLMDSAGCKSMSSAGVQSWVLTARGGRGATSTTKDWRPAALLEYRHAFRRRTRSLSVPFPGRVRVIAAAKAVKRPRGDLSEQKTVAVFNLRLARLDFRKPGDFLLCFCSLRLVFRESSNPVRWHLLSTAAAPRKTQQSLATTTTTMATTTAIITTTTTTMVQILPLCPPTNTTSSTPSEAKTLLKLSTGETF